MLDFLKFRNRGKGRSPGKNSRSSPAEAAPDPGAASRQEFKRKILVVGKAHTFTPGVMEYAGNLAERLGYDLIALNVNPGLETSRLFSPYNQHLQARFTQRARAAWNRLAPELKRQGIQGEQMVKFEGVAQAVNDLNHEVKRIDFVIADAGIEDKEITGAIPLPVFSISGFKGEMRMADKPEKGRSQEIARLVAYGFGAVALYAAVFFNQGTVMKYFSAGGWFAALPIVTVFAVSFVHGAFAHHLWSMLGIEASKTKTVQPRVEPKRPVARKRHRPSLRLDA